MSCSLASDASKFVMSNVSAVAGRYLHPPGGFNVRNHYNQLGSFRGEPEDFLRPAGANMLRRRQDFDEAASPDDDDADEPDEAADHNAAASYRNQDDQNAAAQDGPSGRQGDGYDDNEADGPYEETPVEREGQADLERFFDDHLGASDRDGMDKENLPSNLIASLSEPARLDAFEPSVLRAAPVASIQNPIVRAADRSHLSALPTIQTTSFIRLPDEKKLIVTNQITRNTINAPIVYGDRNGDSGGGRDQTAREDHAPSRFQSSPSSVAGLNDPTNISLNIEVEPLDGSSGVASQTAAAAAQDARNDKMSATGSEVVLTEDDDDDRVYVTNATNKPFRIAALGGYDPEADFQDAAKDLDSYGETPPPPRTTRRPAARPQARRHASALKETSKSDRLQAASHDQQPLGPTQHELSFHSDSPDADMYEDASETDEVTFGQDEPYQTDLEAEMRQQQYDQVGKFGVDSAPKSGKQHVKMVVASQEAPVESRPDGEGSRDARDAHDFNSDDGKVDPDDNDADVDNEYRSSRKPEAAASEPRARNEPRKSPKKGDDMEEGQWINDGADEMDIPSQSHQNFILDKAAKHDAMVRKAAEDEMEAAKQQEEQQPESGAGGGETSSDGEESQRMPNADYLKNDLIEDDSGYAAA